jgi:DNA-binding protein H-NS
VKTDNRHDFPSRNFLEYAKMAATNGLEKFSHLEDKIYRTIELTKALRQEKDDLERQLATARSAAKSDRTAEIDQLLSERAAIRNRVQRMLEAIAAADPEIAEAINR